MADIPAWINLAIAVVAGLGGLAGLAALITSLSNAKNSARRYELDAQQSQLDSLVRIVNELQEENKRLRERIGELELANRWLQRENTALRNALKRAGIDVPEFIPQQGDHN